MRPLASGHRRILICHQLLIYVKERPRPASFGMRRASVPALGLPATSPRGRDHSLRRTSAEPRAPALREIAHTRNLAAFIMQPRARFTPSKSPRVGSPIPHPIEVCGGSRLFWRAASSPGPVRSTRGQTDEQTFMLGLLAAVVGGFAKLWQAVPPGNAPVFTVCGGEWSARRG
jgi:hypothetical protein